MRIKNYGILETAALILIVGAVFLFNIGNVRFVGDESMWISRSYYFELYFSGRQAAFLICPPVHLTVLAFRIKILPCFCSCSSVD